MGTGRVTKDHKPVGYRQNKWPGLKRNHVLYVTGLDICCRIVLRKRLLDVCVAGRITVYATAPNDPNQS